MATLFLTSRFYLVLLEAEWEALQLKQPLVEVHPFGLVASPDLRAYAANTIFSTDIVDDAFKIADLASSAVTAAKIKQDEIKAAEIATDAVGAAELQAVTKLSYGVYLVNLGCRLELAFYLYFFNQFP